jgi:hypothetical protein
MKQYKASCDQNLNLLYKKYCLVETEKVFGLSNQCSIVNRIGLSTMKFGTLCVRYAYMGRLCQRLTDFYKFMKILRTRFYLSSTYKSDYFRDEKNLYLNPETPRFKMARDKVHLNYGKSQTIRNLSITRWHTLVLLWRNNFTCF